MTAAAEAKHLDSVTDHVQEQELDESKVNEAMSALSIKKAKGTDDAAASSAAAARKVSKEDVAFIVAELEVTDEVAEKALRDVIVEGEESSSAILSAALKQLIVG